MRSSISPTNLSLFNDLSTSDFGINLGGGVTGFFSDNVGIRGDVRYFRSVDVSDAKSTFHLKQSQASATREVAAILTFPLRNVFGNAKPNELPIGVLSFDALSDEAADGLGLLFAQFRAGEQPELAALVDRISLYI